MEKGLRRNVTREFKLDLVRQGATGQKRLAQIYREYGLAESELLRWRREYEARGEAGFSSHERKLWSGR